MNGGGFVDRVGAYSAPGHGGLRANFSPDAPPDDGSEAELPHRVPAARRLLRDGEVSGEDALVWVVRGRDRVWVIGPPGEWDTREPEIEAASDESR